MGKNGRYRYRGFVAVCFALMLLSGCGKSSGSAADVANSSEDSHVDIKELQKENSDVFAWVTVPDTNINYPVLQNGEGDDRFYTDHNWLKESDPNGAIYIEAANLRNMCDFNEVLHGQNPGDGTMFSDLSKFLDRTFFEEHPYIYVYLDGNALIYYTFAAYTRDDKRLIEQYDFTYAFGCQAFLDEIYSGSRSMTKNVRTGWEDAVTPENFIITLSTASREDPGKQIILVGCLVGDLRGTIDRYVDYSDPGSEWD